MKKIDILCCCKPGNLHGHIEKEAGLAAGLELKVTVDEEGQEGEAFSANHRPTEELLSIEGFEAPVDQKKKKKTWRKTWR